jgi:hypothetical protein
MSRSLAPASIPVRNLPTCLRHPGVRLNTLMTANQDRQDAKPRKYSDELPQFSGRCDS